MSYIDDNRPTLMNRRPTEAEQRAFNNSMDVMAGAGILPKRITVNRFGQAMLVEYFESKRITGPIRAVPITLEEGQTLPYVGHNS